jgi:hypothetical protein
MLSCLSVNQVVVACLRNRCSGSYLCISPLHDPFRLPPTHSRTTVSNHIKRLSRLLSNQTYSSTYAPFKPNKSGQRLHPPYYRGCWHGVSRCLFLGYRQIIPQDYSSSPIKAVYNAERLHPARGMAGSELPPLPNIPYCCLP